MKKRIYKRIMANEQILDSMPTLDIIKELSKRQGIVLNSAESDKMKIAIMMIVGQEDQDEIVKICSTKWKDDSDE